MKRFLNPIVQLIARSCDPDEIILFGSFAKGNIHLESDLDILVIADFKEPKHLRARELRERLNGCCISVDLLLVTREEMEAEGNQYGFFNCIQGDSKVLYTRRRGILISDNICQDQQLPEASDNENVRELTDAKKNY